MEGTVQLGPRTGSARRCHSTNIMGSTSFWAEISRTLGQPICPNWKSQADGSSQWTLVCLADNSPCFKAGPKNGWQKPTNCCGTVPGSTTLPSLQVWILWFTGWYHCKAWTLMHQSQGYKAQTWQNKWHLGQGHGSCKTHFCTWASGPVFRWFKATRWHYPVLLETWHAASLGCDLPGHFCPKLSTPVIQRSWQSSWESRKREDPSKSYQTSSLWCQLLLRPWEHGGALALSLSKILVK